MKKLLLLGFLTLATFSNVYACGEGVDTSRGSIDVISEDTSSGSGQSPTVFDI